MGISSPSAVGASSPCTDSSKKDSLSLTIYSRCSGSRLCHSFTNPSNHSGKKAACLSPFARTFRDGKTTTVIRYSIGLSSSSNIIKTAIYKLLNNLQAAVLGDRHHCGPELTDNIDLHARWVGKRVLLSPISHDYSRRLGSGLFMDMGSATLKPALFALAG